MKTRISLSYPEQTLNGHAVDCYFYFLDWLRSLSAVEYIYRTKAWVKRSDYRTFGLSNLRTIDREPTKSGIPVTPALKEVPIYFIFLLFSG